MSDAVRNYRDFADDVLDKPLWNWIDLGVGFLTGIYGPVIQRARKYDCFGEFFNWSSEFITWHVTFNGWWSETDPMSWIFVATNLLA